jgi:STE24 endopeptidase
MNLFGASFIVLYLLQFAFFAGLEVLNLRHLRRMGSQCPAVFLQFIDEPLYRGTMDYTRDKTVLGMARGAVSEALLLTMIVSGVLAVMDARLSEVLQWPAARGLLFFLAPGLILYIAGLPFEYRRTFVIEERYGFNRTTRGRWVMDQVKGGMLSLVIFAPLLLLVLWLVRVHSETWWLWAFGAVSAVQLLMAVLYPRCIAPIFNRFRPLEDRLLAEQVRELMERNGVRVERILEMDAGARSRHSNAYFTGLGKTKQIVLFDTLLESHPHDEILAVLAHEAGHFKRRHILKQLAVSELALLLGFYGTARLLEWPPLTSAFGFDPASHHAGLFILMVFWQKAGAFLLPLFMAQSRRFEREADAYSARMLGTAKPLVTAFKRMAAHNLANLVPHPFYVAFHYSHPPLAERITLLENAFNTPPQGGAR